MRLDLIQLAPLVRGATRVTEEDGWFQLDRFTGEEHEAYRRAGNLDFFARTFDSASIRLALRTDSHRLHFVYRLGNALDRPSAYRPRNASDRPFAWFDLRLDGVLTDHFGTAEASDGHMGEASLDLGAGEKLVEVAFPWSRRTDIKEVELDDNASFEAVRRPRRLLAYGDSITHGYDAIYPSLAYIEQFASMIGADVNNKAIAGDRFFPDLIDGKELEPPDLITVAYGTNDWTHQTPESTSARARAFLEKLSIRYPGSPVLAISPIWRADWDDLAGRHFQEPATAIDALLREAAKGLPNITVIDGWPLVPHLPEFYSDRRLHPNDLGFGLYARHLLQAVRDARLLR